MSDIKENTISYLIHIGSDLQTSKMLVTSNDSITEVQLYRITDLLPNSTIRIIYNNALTVEEKNMDSLQILFEMKKILFGRKSGDIIHCVEYDLENGSQPIFGDLKREKFNNGVAYDMLLKIDYLNGDGLFWNENEIKYYIFPKLGWPSIIIDKYISRFANIIELEPLLPEEKLSNYCISVPRELYDIRELIMSMIADRLLTIPQFMNIPINKIMRFIGYDADNQIHQDILDEQSGLNGNEIRMLLEIMKKNSLDREDLYNKMISRYPVRAFTDDPFAQYDLITEYNRKGRQRKKYKNILLQLKEEGIIDVRWVSEFSLYQLIKKKYSDCIYQCHFDWLGQQSLDIYIPCIGTAIEYQGQQHYEPIELFGGEEGYKKTKERDNRKKALCEKNNIRLIYWPYSLKINEDNFEKIIES